MNFTQEIAKIRLYAMTAKTAIYNEDAMTAIELAGCTASKVNECVDAINGILAILEKLSENNGFAYDPIEEKIIL